MSKKEVKRDSRGRWLSGSTGNPIGGSKKRKGYLTVLQSECTTERWEWICRKAITQAIKGDAAARKWLSDYLLGRPVQRVKADISTRSVIDARFASDIERVYGNAGNGSDSELPSDTD